jgi:hypothetical protein
MENQSEPIVPVQSKKKRHIFRWIFLLFILLVIGVAGYSGFVPGLSDTMGANEPRDLGVKTTKTDFTATLQKAGFVLDDSAGFGPDTRISYSGQKNVDVTLSNEEISSLMNYDHAKAYPISDAQVKVSPDGTLEGSAKVNASYAGYSVNNAVYAKGKIEVTGPTSVVFNIDSLVIGRVPMPIRAEDKAKAEQLVHEKLNSIPGFSIGSVSYEGGLVHFKGTIPASAKRVKR